MERKTMMVIAMGAILSSCAGNPNVRDRISEGWEYLKAACAIVNAIPIAEGDEAVSVGGENVESE